MDERQHNCLCGESVALDDGVVSALINAVKDPSKFWSLLDRLQDQAEGGNLSIGIRAAALLQLLRAVLKAVAARQVHTAASTCSTRRRRPRRT